MKTQFESTRRRAGVALMEGLIALTLLSLCWLTFVTRLPRIAIVLECLALAWLVWMRTENIVAVSRMRGGRPPLVLNRRWPLLIATLAIAWLVGVEIVSYSVSVYRDAGLIEPLAETSLGVKVLTHLVALVAVTSTIVAPLIVVACGFEISRERGYRKNSGPRADPPASTFGPFPPTGLTPAPLGASAELAFA